MVILLKFKHLIMIFFHLKIQKLTIRLFKFLFFFFLLSTVNLNCEVLQTWTTYIVKYYSIHFTLSFYKNWFKERMFLYHWVLQKLTNPQSHAVLYMINTGVFFYKKKTEVRTFKWKLTKISPFLVCKTLSKNLQLLSCWGFIVCCSHNNRLAIIFADLSPLDSSLWYPSTTLTVHGIFVFTIYHPPEMSASTISRRIFVQTCHKSFVCAFIGVGFHVCFWRNELMLFFFFHLYTPKPINLSEKPDIHLP